MAQDSLLVTFLNAAGLASGFAVFLGIAALYGANQETDAFFLALAVTAFVANALVNVITSVFVPLVTEQLIRVKGETGRLVGSSVVYMVGFSLVGAGLVALAAGILPRLSGLEMTEDVGRLISRDVLVLVPMIPILTLCSALSAVYYSAGSYWVPAVAVVARYGSTLGAILVLRPSLHAAALSAGFVAGSLVQLAPLVLLWPSVGVKLSFGWKPDQRVTRLLRLTWPWLIGALALQLEPVVSRFFASQLSPGSVSLLDYASRLTVGAMEVLTGGVLLVTLVDWSATVAQGDMLRLGRRLRQTVDLMLFVALPLVAMGIVLRRPLMALLFQRGVFDVGMANATGDVWFFFLLGIPIDIVARVYVRVLLATQDTRTLGLVSVFRLMATVLLSFVLMRVMGVQGLALATTLALGLLLAFVIHDSASKAGNLPVGSWRVILRVLACAIVGALIAGLANSVMTDISPWIRLPVAAVAGGGAYLLSAWQLGIPELRSIVRLVVSQGEVGIRE